MAYNHISLIAQNLEKLDWLTDDWVTTFVGKNAIKRARKQVASHTARQFGVLSGSRGLKRISCSTVAEGEDLRYLAQVTVTKDELTDSKCDCSKKPAEYVQLPSWPQRAMSDVNLLTLQCVCLSQWTKM